GAARLRRHRLLLGLALRADPGRPRVPGAEGGFRRDRNLPLQLRHEVLSGREASVLRRLGRIVLLSCCLAAAAPAWAQAPSPGGPAIIIIVDLQRILRE